MNRTAIHPAPAAPRADALWQVELFATALLAPTADPRAVSARRAYQDALYDRALLLDVRSAHERHRDGRLPADLPVIEVRPGVDLGALALLERVYVVGGEAPSIEPADLAGLDRDRPEVLAVDGGFAAWRAAGLPVTR